LTAARTTIITQNKEGLISLPGYLSIYLTGIGTGIFVLPPDPSFFYRLHSLKRNDTEEEQELKEKKKEKSWIEKPGKLVSVLGSYAILWCVGYGIVRGMGWEVSRRLVRSNYPITIWKED
jgi:phosphatidylinositol glycan class W